MSSRLSRVVLCDTSSAVCDGWRSLLETRSGRGIGLDVSVCNDTLATLLKRENDDGATGSMAIVSPGNSFGFLGGGFDRGLFQQFGGERFEQWFRMQLGRRYHPVGSATAVDVGSCGFECGKVRYVVHVPTMVTPCRAVYDGERPVVSGYSRVFDATWNALVTCPAEVEVLVVPGMGTGYAGIPREVACKSMVFALRVFALQAQGVSRELQNALIMYYQGVGYGGFVDEGCLRECRRLGIDLDMLERFDVTRDSIEDILPRL